MDRTIHKNDTTKWRTSVNSLPDFVWWGYSIIRSPPLRTKVTVGLNAVFNQSSIDFVSDSGVKVIFESGTEIFKAVKTEFVRKSKDQRFNGINKGSCGLMDEVSASQPRATSGSWVRTPHGSRQWFPIWHQYWLVPGSRLESDLNKLTTCFTIELK